MTADRDRRLLLRLAREAVAAHLGAPPAAPRVDEPLASRRGGAFVTLHRAGSLRGCIGHIEPGHLLVDVVARCAVSASTADPRFPSVTMAELSEVVIELSLLGPLEPIDRDGEIEIGRHGLVVERGWQRGLLLPQVASERQWDRETFLAETCRKAGLPADAWTRGASLWRFEAEIFDED
jgi:AmmeMemoRadiSam system protein A